MINDVQRQKPIVGLFSEADFLSLSILEYLLSNQCFVKIFTNNKELWKNRTSHLSKFSNFEIFSENKNDKNFLNLNYSIFISGFFGKKNLYDRVYEFSNFKIPSRVKKILIFPFERINNENKFKIKTNDNLAIIYLGDLLGARIDLESNLLFPSLLKSACNSFILKVGFGERFYPIFVSDVAKLIVKWLFSFGPYGKETLLLGDEISVNELYKHLLNHLPNLKLVFEVDKEPRILPRGVEIKRISSNLPLFLSETVGWILRTPKINKPKNIVKKRNLGRNFKYSLLGAFISIVLLLSPFFIVGLSAGILSYGYKIFTNKNTTNTKNLFLIAKKISIVGMEESAIFMHIPLVGPIYKESYFAGSLIYQISDIGTFALPLISNSSELFAKVIGKDIFDPQVYVDKMLVDIDNLYQKFSFLEADTKLSANNQVFLAKIFLAKFNFEKIKTLIDRGKIILFNLPNDLGISERKKYLILFQNNMELRPTGGFIGSFGLITFEGGRMTDFSVFDVYSADGQLRGHVEPPTAIKNYLGEANWYLRDSNWDPDFSVSAKRAEWFLDKEIDQNVDGVIGLDLEVVKRILKITGPIFLADYNLTIDESNLYEKTQAEAQTNFFPGSTRKASFLTALSRNLLLEIEKKDFVERFSIVKSFYKDLEERHIQIFLHNKFTNEAVSQLGWGGEVRIPFCNQNCYADMIGLVEANLGVNKANYFIKRSEKLDIKILGNKIKRTLNLTLINSANPVLAESGRYKVYLRLLTVPNTQNNSVFVVSGLESNEVPFDVYQIREYQEIGALIEVLPGQTKNIIFSWENDLPLNLNQEGILRFYLRKQGGVSDSPISISFSSPEVAIIPPEGFALTGSDGYVYNTTLAKDIFLNFIIGRNNK